ncbi:hypothetical protein BROOK1789B_143 [Bathymodiolus brooksi thiotrophic gill symbiont]|nr:hypothetical protein BROOK1789B_143 [Bathymodiolus brooksi thiotrophic gill symbiont]
MLLLTELEVIVFASELTPDTVFAIREVSLYVVDVSSGGK